MRQSIIFYRSFFDAISELTDEQKGVIYTAIFEYSFNEKIIELNGICKAIFTLIQPQIDANNKRYQNGKKGGRPSVSEVSENQNKTKNKPKQNQTKTKPKPNENVNVNVNVNENVNENVNVNDRERKRIFSPPAKNEVEEFFLNNGSSETEANRFYNHFQSNGWLVGGRSKMKDWNAAARNWISRSASYQIANRGKPSLTETLQNQFTEYMNKNNGQ